MSSDRFATHPFKLIETPVHAQKATKPYDQYVEAASVMAISHNVLIRGLNSIYLQAPHVKPQDIPDFINYSLAWEEILNAHHQMEEELMFPQIEDKAGEKGIMDHNVEQHHAFLPGLLAFKEYLTTTLPNPASFSATQVHTLIDAFAPTLIVHLSDEIPSLLSLSRFGSKLPLLSIVNTSSQQSAKFHSKVSGAAFFFRNQDFAFEDGLWANWPPIPAPVFWVLQRTVAAWHEGWWRFAGSNAKGQLKELYALE